MANPVDMVVPGLYIGGQAGACNLQVLKQNGITHIVNSAAASCTDTFPHEFVYKSLPLIDTPSQNMLQHFGETSAFIAESRARGGRVLVHCIEGKSRSSTIILAYLMDREGFSLADAYALLKRCRPIANPNEGFQIQLQHYESLCRNKGQQSQPRQQQQQQYQQQMAPPMMAQQPQAMPRHMHTQPQPQPQPQSNFAPPPPHHSANQPPSQTQPLPQPQANNSMHHPSHRPLLPQQQQQQQQQPRPSPALAPMRPFDAPTQQPPRQQHQPMGQHIQGPSLSMSSSAVGGSRTWESSAHPQGMWGSHQQPNPNSSSSSNFSRNAHVHGHQMQQQSWGSVQANAAFPDKSGSVQTPLLHDRAPTPNNGGASATVQLSKHGAVRAGEGSGERRMAQQQQQQQGGVRPPQFQPRQLQQQQLQQQQREMFEAFSQHRGVDGVRSTSPAPPRAASPAVPGPGHYEGHSKRHGGQSVGGGGGGGGAGGEVGGGGRRDNGGWGGAGGGQAPPRNGPHMQGYNGRQTPPPPFANSQGGRMSPAPPQQQQYQQQQQQLSFMGGQGGRMSPAPAEGRAAPSASPAPGFMPNSPMRQRQQQQQQQQQHQYQQHQHQHGGIRDNSGSVVGAGLSEVSSPPRPTRAPPVPPSRSPMVRAPNRYDAKQQQHQQQQTPERRGVSGFGVLPRDEAASPQEDYGWLPNGVGDNVSPNLSPGDEGNSLGLDDSVEPQEDLGHVRWVELMGMKAKELTC